MSDEPPWARVMESVRLPNNAELERWCRAKILPALDQAIEWPDQSDEPTPAQSCATGVLFPTRQLGRMNNGVEAFRSQLQKELGLSIGPKDPLLALWVSQKELLEQNAVQQQKLLREFQAALGESQTAWSEQAKALAQQSLNAGLQAAQNGTALLLEEAVRMNAAAVRQAFEEGIGRMEQALATAAGSPG